jgi:hypothetical protein
MMVISDNIEFFAEQELLFYGWMVKCMYTAAVDIIGLWFETLQNRGTAVRRVDPENIHT